MTCSSCHGDNDRAPHRYCRACHAAYQRNWRRQRAELLQALLANVKRETFEARP
jgi:NMD protein affecting ribosome stability and mRNA decay